MTHYRARIINLPIVHASAVEAGTFLYCRPYAYAAEQVEPTDDLITCGLCRGYLAEGWARYLEQAIDPDYEYYLAADREGPSRVRIVGRRTVEGKGDFIRFIRRWNDGQESLAFYRVERFINLLIDGNAYAEIREAGDTWRLEAKLRAESSANN